MTGPDLFQEAAAELYSSDPDTFIERRSVLVARARAAGQAPAAKRIAGLRKPTRSAWVLNQLVRAEPGVPAELARLGQELRAAQRSLDGTAIRELSLRRRQLIDALARRAFAVSGPPAPPAALRDEVTATLGAALADPEVAERLAAGTLERAARSEGFGPEAPTLTLVTSSGSRRPLRAGPASGAPRARGTPRALAVAGADGPARPAATPGAERELRRQSAAAAAEQAAADAARAAEAATAAEQDAERAVQALEERLADARRSLSDTRAQARRARARQRQARQALDRLRR